MIPLTTMAIFYFHEQLGTTRQQLGWQRASNQDTELLINACFFFCLKDVYLVSSDD